MKANEVMYCIEITIGEQVHCSPITPVNAFLERLQSYLLQHYALFCPHKSHVVSRSARLGNSFALLQGYFVIGKFLLCACSVPQVTDWTSTTNRWHHGRYVLLYTVCLSWHSVIPVVPSRLGNWMSATHLWWWSKKPAVLRTISVRNHFAPL